MKKSAKTKTKEDSLELKYCERCGGLWLRPAGGQQIYCTVCARAMAELPPPSTEVKRKTIPRRDWEIDEDFERYEPGGMSFDQGGGSI